jgi:hypothetical protein
LSNVEITFRVLEVINLRLAIFCNFSQVQHKINMLGLRSLIDIIMSRVKIDLYRHIYSCMSRHDLNLSCDICDRQILIQSNQKSTYIIRHARTKSIHHHLLISSLHRLHTLIFFCNKENRTFSGTVGVRMCRLINLIQMSSGTRNFMSMCTFYS